MGHSLLIFEAMKVTLVLFASVAFVLGCPENPPCPEGSYPCPTGSDPETGCPWPDMCMEPQLDVNGMECAVACPCKYDELTCGGGFDEVTTCQMGPQCIPMKGGMVGKDGSDCPVTCPCKGDEMACVRGVDPNECPIPDMCMPMKGGPIGKDGTECAVNCPCQDNEQSCPMKDPIDANGCAFPEMCIPQKDECPPNMP